MTDSDMPSIGQRGKTQVWIDCWRERLVARALRFVGRQPTAVCPGPIWPQSPSGGIRLCWFPIPPGSDQPHAIARQINQVLKSDPHAGESANVGRLLERVRAIVRTGVKPASYAAQERNAQSSQVSRVLLVDEREKRGTTVDGQTRSRRTVFIRMVRAAVNAHPGAEFHLLQSADGGRGSWLSSKAARYLPEIKTRTTASTPLPSVLSQVNHAYVIDASEGMHALLFDTQVHIFGTPYYAGWGLTHDEIAVPGREIRPTIAALFDVAFVRLARYINPATHATGNLDDLLDAIGLQHEISRRFEGTPKIVGLNFQLWKRPFATPYLSSCNTSLRWSRDPSTCRADECVALWGARVTDKLPADTPHIRIEDGFLHSCGLGSDMSAPRSQIIDRSGGIYFDASRPNELTSILNEANFDTDELSRAARLRKTITAQGITKYNLGRSEPVWTAPPGRVVVLVAGQVADDASIRLGTRQIKSAEELLQAARLALPDAYIVYKPHPDVLSGNRNGLIHAQQFADIVDANADLLSLIEVCDEVHTLSSLAGFDALLRGKKVVTYGWPFYAGWGLTHDRADQVPWRNRVLSIDMLVAGALLRYPLYWDWRTHMFTTPECVVEQLAYEAQRPLGRMRHGYARLPIKIIRWSRNTTRHFMWRYTQHKERNI